MKLQEFFCSVTMWSQAFYWSRIINLIIHQYLFDKTICIIWNENIEFELQMEESANYQPIIGIWKGTLEESFKTDIVDFTGQREQLQSKGVAFDNLVEKLTMSIESSHCESFLVFQDDIPHFSEAFTNASKYSIWRSMHNRFIFGYNKALVRNDYFQHYLFQDQPNILLIESENSTSSIFNLKTNKFVGTRADHQEEIYLLNRYNAETETFEGAPNLFPDKTSDLMGREVVSAAINYKPDIIVAYDSYKNVRDLAYDSDADEGMALLDGTEAAILLTFCEKYNCTVQIDSSETDDWGFVYPNGTGNGALGMVAKRKAEVAMGAMYLWYEDYLYLDLSMYVGRSGITCMVPAPRRLASWSLPLDPFQPTLWAAVMTCCVIEILGLLFTRKFAQILASEESPWLNSFKFGYTTTFKLLLSQPSSENVKTASVRVFLCTCFLNDIIITSIYGGGLASILTIPSLEEVADSLDRMISHELKWSANSEAWVYTIKNSEDQRMESVIKNFKIFSTEEIRKLAVSENMGFTLERLTFGHFALEDIFTDAALDRLKIMMDDIYFTYTVSFVPRLWPLLKRYNDYMCMWHSSGFDKFWEWKTVSKYMNVNIQNRIEASAFINFDELGPVAMGVSNMAGILVIWLLGIILSILVFTWEVLHYRSEQKKQMKKLAEEQQENVFDWTT